MWIECRERQREIGEREQEWIRCRCRDTFTTDAIADRYLHFVCVIPSATKWLNESAEKQKLNVPTSGNMNKSEKTLCHFISLRADCGCIVVGGTLCLYYTLLYVVCAWFDFGALCAFSWFIQLDHLVLFDINNFWIYSIWTHSKRFVCSSNHFRFSSSLQMTESLRMPPVWSRTPAAFGKLNQ